MPSRYWPEIDQKSWQTSCASADLLSEDSGARSARRPITNRKAEKGYGRWMTFLTITAPYCLAVPPAMRITRERVTAYVEHLITLKNSTATILARLQELGEVAKVMGPTQDWRFINQLASRVRAVHKPARDKRNLKLSDELLDLAFALISKAQLMKGWAAAILYRDGLIIALLALMPLRRRNLEGLFLGRNLIELNQRWVVALEADETKTHAPHEMDLPDILVEPLRTYLQLYRPILLSRIGRWSKPVGGALWVSKDGSPMTQMAIYDRVRAHTKAAFGTAINPHLFRDAAATTMAIADPEHVRISAPLLGHRTFTTTERYYQQAKGYEAHRKYINALRELRKQ